MGEFDSIKKIIRLFTIALLALWLAQCLFGAHESAKVMSEHHQVTKMQMLYNQGFKIRQMLNTFFISYDRLPDPGEYDDLECAHPYARCPFRESQGTFYVRQDDWWLGITPTIEDDRLAFHCQVSHRIKSDTPWQPPYDCEVVDRPLPVHWPKDQPAKSQ